MKRKTTLLIVEDEAAIRAMIRFALSDCNFQIEEADSSMTAEKILTKKNPDIILLDWMLPGKSGIDFIHWLKQKKDYQNIPVILLTAKAEAENKIKGLNTGADDYMTKPFSPGELIARVKAVLRRGTIQSPENTIHFRSLKLNSQSHAVSIENQPLKLTANEYRLLLFFLKHQNRVYSRDQLLDHVWGSDKFIDVRTVDVQIRRLRDRLKPFNYHKYLMTVRGSGYIYKEDIPASSRSD